MGPWGHTREELEAAVAVASVRGDLTGVEYLEAGPETRRALRAMALERLARDAVEACREAYPGSQVPRVRVQVGYRTVDVTAQVEAMAEEDGEPFTAGGTILDFAADGEGDFLAATGLLQALVEQALRDAGAAGLTALGLG